MSQRQASTRHLNLPLGEDLHRRLRAEAERTGRPATHIAREAIQRFLEDARRSAVHEAIASYAAVLAGTTADLDPALEEAAVEYLRDGEGEGEAPVVREAKGTRKAIKQRGGSR